MIKQKYKALAYKLSAEEIDWIYTIGDSAMGNKALCYGAGNASTSWESAYNAFTGQHLNAAAKYNKIDKTLRKVSTNNRNVLLAAFTPRQWKVSPRGVEIEDYSLKHFMQLADSNISLVGVCFLSPLAEKYHNDQYTKSIKNWERKGFQGKKPNKESFLDFLIWSAALGRTMMLDRIRGNCSELLNKALAEYDIYRLNRIKEEKKFDKQSWGLEEDE